VRDSPLYVLLVWDIPCGVTVGMLMRIYARIFRGRTNGVTYSSLFFKTDDLSDPIGVYMRAYWLLVQRGAWGCYGRPYQFARGRLCGHVWVVAVSWSI